jgi:hypothetical protein
MHAVILGVTWGLMGLDVGWRALPGGGVEYIIQIAPHELEVFKQDKSIEGDIPAQLRDIRSYRIVVGNDVLPKQDPPKTAATAPAPPTSPLRPESPTTTAGQRKASGSNFYSPLTSLWDRYPFAQSASDPAKRTGQQEPSGPKKTSADRTFDEKQPKSDRTTPKDTPKETPKPWTPFIAVVVVLCGSLGGNLYMGWITWETRARYHALVRRRKKAERHLREKAHEPDVEAEEE